MIPASGGWSSMKGSAALGWPLALLERQGLAVAVDDHVIAGFELAGEHLGGERILNEALDGALEWSGAIGGIVPGVGDGLSGGLGELDGDLAAGEQLAQSVEL